MRIGVLALRGPEKAVEMWSATADYLGKVMPEQHFRIVPLGFDDVRLAVRQGSIDFVLTNSSYYVELESLYGVSAIACCHHFVPFFLQEDDMRFEKLNLIIYPK